MTKKVVAAVAVDMRMQCNLGRLFHFFFVRPERFHLQLHFGLIWLGTLRVLLVQHIRYSSVIDCIQSKQYLPNFTYERKQWIDRP